MASLSGLLGGLGKLQEYPGRIGQQGHAAHADLDRFLLIGTPADIVKALKEYVDVGVRYITLGGAHNKPCQYRTQPRTHRARSCAARRG